MASVWLQRESEDHTAPIESISERLIRAGKRVDEPLDLSLIFKNHAKQSCIWWHVLVIPELERPRQANLWGSLAS